ncbi:FG-GAP repeat domain-containing protein [Geobacter argillaceus]|uniref:VCBS repeat protein n=1 Tax=Geobacter argillaceus TaxID=345631 RepID=A0A562V8B4_9BACT|nr:VCBS repeat-containing protein [Geobacter argillaceus]TWJ14038.1 hypothetical protein JN12_03609 [Geobacter argillaceus]
MKAILSLIALSGLILSFSHPCDAEQIKAYVTGFTITGVQNRDELKMALQLPLMSRLNGERILVIDSESGAQVMVSGSYLAVGRIFSIDAVAKSVSGSVITRAFVQGESQDELIPSVGKLAQLLTEGIVKGYQPVSTREPHASGIIRSTDEIAARAGVIKSEQVEKSAGGRWSSRPVPGAMIGIAEGPATAGGARELYIAGDHAVKLYSQGKELELLSEVTLPGDQKILGIDTADLDGDGSCEVYLTVWNGNALASQVWTKKGNSLEKIADNLPYYFRGIALNGGEKKIYVQQMGSDSDFYGDVFELVRKGKEYETRNPLKLPRFGNLFNFNMFSDNRGTSYVVVLHSDGNLIVYTAAGQKLWRSSDKYGGSETFFQRPDLSNVRVTGESYRWIHIDQRIVVTKQGEIIVPQNSGFWNIGNIRSFSKNVIYCFTWNGSSLQKKWHTAQSETYLPDYFYDGSRNELTLLEMIDRAALANKGTSAVSVIKID